jgi:hypothetical protein
MSEVKLIVPLSDALNQHGVRLNILGRKDLLPEEVQVAIPKAENMTRQNDRRVPPLFRVILLVDIPCQVYLERLHAVHLP